MLILVVWLRLLPVAVPFAVCKYIRRLIQPGRMQVHLKHRHKSRPFHELGQ